MLNELRRMHGVRMEVHVRGGRARSERVVAAAEIARRELRGQSPAQARGADAVLMILVADREFALAVAGERWTADAGRWTDAGAKLSEALAAGRPVEGIRGLIQQLLPLLAPASHST